MAGQVAEVVELTRSALFWCRRQSRSPSGRLSVGCKFVPYKVSGSVGRWTMPVQEGKVGTLGCLHT
jgi:hypothetical protein